MIDILERAVGGVLIGHSLPLGDSSHSEAPLIGQDPRADNTDLYAFVSPDGPDTVTIIANYIPLEAPASGPNFYSFDDSVLYEINIDNNGDAVEDLTYQFRFNTATRNPNTFLYNVGPITSLDDPNWNRPQTYSVTASATGTAMAMNGATSVVGGCSGATSRRRRTTSGRGRRRTTRARRGGRHDPARRHQGLRGPARRPVLRRPRLDLRPRRAAAVQPVPPDPAPDGAGTRRRRALQRAHDRDPGADRSADPRRAPDDRDLREREPAAHRSCARRDQPRQRRSGAGLAARQAADQRGGHPARARRTSGTARTPRTTRSSRPSTATPR